MPVRTAAVAGSWYPGNAEALEREVDGYVVAARVPQFPDVQAVLAPHAGMMFSGPVAAYSYKAAAQHAYEVAVLVGPSHFVAFEGVSVWPKGAFDSPLGRAWIDEEIAAELLTSHVIRDLPRAHEREHSLEMQLPFLRRLLPDVRIVPLLIGYQDRDTIDELADALGRVARMRRTLLVASSDLSHYFDAATAASLDHQVQACVNPFDPDALLELFETYPEDERGRCVACGGGAAIAVMKAARALGARDGRVLRYAHSGDISGDNEHVVGYLAAAFGTFDHVE
jgi:hypothetical protein